MEVPEPKTTTLKLEWLVSISVMHLFSWRDASTEGRLETNINSMLTTLRIKNLALVDDLTLELSEGLNIITGETGAGKSIIMGALNLILGQQADRSLIRSGADQCVIEAVFHVGGEILPVLESILEAWGLEPCQDQTLFLKRSMRTSGANRQFVNGSPTTLEALAQLGDYLVDMHGPHDHQSLLDGGRQLQILDAFGKLEAHRQAFGSH